LHFVTDPAERDALRQDERFVESPHHGDRGWLSVRVDNDLDWVEVAGIRGHIADGRIAHFQVSIKVGFRMDDPD